MAETILVTGGAGYIGSHLVASLLSAGHQVVLLDDLSRGHQEAVDRARQVGAGWAELEVGDLADPAFVAAVLHRWRPDAVVHLAAFKSVAESVKDPERYEHTNVVATGILADALVHAQIRRVVYASTASVYGDADASTAIDESGAIGPISPYAQTKYLGEQELETRAIRHDWGLVHLRFFNVCGAHPSSQLGEFVDKPQNLLPILFEAVEKHTAATVFGTDWPTRDGTCVRDYIHVMDIVSGIEAALAHTRFPGVDAFNLGTGTGSTVLEVIDAVQRATGQNIEVVNGPRREGDPAVSVADATRAQTVLGWHPVHDLTEMAQHAWHWMQQAPKP